VTGSCVLRETTLKGRPRLVPRVSLSMTIKGVFSPNTFIYELAQLTPYELTHVRASPGDCAAGWAQAARKV
jgi:hypothetical protein